MIAGLVLEFTTRVETVTDAADALYCGKAM
jgi:hypothetical protein